ncbi:lysine--tRNA ligase [Patescibacteria group bacterium]|nr:lysine--tRNA ligase [Patescibacteria group bacterium]
MDDETRVRKEKIRRLREAGIEPYPAAVERSHDVQTVLEQFERLEAEKTPVALVGRLKMLRAHGGLTFAHLEDESSRMQLAFKRDTVGLEMYARLQKEIDLGDILAVQGIGFLTKVGERSVDVQSFQLVAKAMRPPPEKWHGLVETETRYRQRELDLMANEEVRKNFVLRSRAVSALRHFLDAQGFLEVETPILQNIPGGANARPFITHHNALDIDLYLRIAPELYLKRLLVGGYEKIYEIARCFRNEGIDYSHNPEFTQIELYWAYVDKETYLGFLEEMVRHILRETIGSLIIPHPEGDLDFSGAIPRVTFRDAILQACGIDIDAYSTTEGLVAAAKKKALSVDFTGCIGMSEHLDLLYKKTARAAIIQPTWVLDYPVSMKPLARRHPSDPTKSATAQLVVRGAEINNVYYHELNDPEDQRARFEEQQELKEQGSDEAHWMDEGFLTALEHGMPPAGGLGMGIDRLMMLITGVHSIKETILFPTLRPVQEQSPALEVSTT